MKTVIIYASIHHANTKKVAQVINEELDGSLVSFKKVTEEDVAEADVVGFGSGIYFGDFHKALLNFVEVLPKCKGKKAFIFSTSGISTNLFFNKGHKSIRELLEKKNFGVVGEFNCPGYDTNGPLRYIGGIRKGRPNENDLKKARDFARKVKSKF